MVSDAKKLVSEAVFHLTFKPLTPKGRRALKNAYEVHKASMKGVTAVRATSAMNKAMGFKQDLLMVSERPLLFVLKSTLTGTAFKRFSKDNFRFFKDTQLDTKELDKAEGLKKGVDYELSFDRIWPENVK